MSEEEFKKVYKQIVNEDVIKELETAKIERDNNGKYKTILAVSIVILSIIVLSIMTVLEELNVNIGVMVITLAIMLVGTGLYIWKIFSKIEWKDTYGDILKNKVVKPIEKIIHEGYTYIPEEGISEKIFENLKLYVFHDYKTSKLLYGALKHDCKFKMANIQATSTSSDYSATSDIERFSGICIEIEIVGKLENKLYLKSKSRSFTQTAKQMRLHKSKVLTENKQFDKIYDVCTDDIKIVNKILKENIIQKLLRYYEMNKKPCEIVIQEGYIYIMFPRTYMFDIILYEGEETYKKALENYKKINFVFELANDIIDEIYN